MTEANAYAGAYRIARTADGYVGGVSAISLISERTGLGIDLNRPAMLLDDDVVTDGQA
jgi:hypothetical protein